MTVKVVGCGYCGATGKVGSGYGSYAKTMCPVCLGRGRISVDANAVKCRGCNGTGRHYTGYHTLCVDKHSDCHGKGWVKPVMPSNLQPCLSRTARKR
ncbi:MAG: hypothetical protein JXA01_02400 [Dehalococcoidia bacterium]|nr:hypothetical protein [Dehalococcoidia bacterium]